MAGLRSPLAVGGGVSVSLGDESSVSGLGPIERGEFCEGAAVSVCKANLSRIMEDGLPTFSSSVGKEVGFRCGEYKSL